MKKKFYKILLLITFLFLYHSNLFTGIISETLVSTPDGLVPVENLHIGDAVIGYCCKCKKLVQSPITNIKKKIIKKLILLKIKNETLLISKKHIFFDPVKCKWIRARNLTCKNCLMSYNFTDDNILLSKLQCCSIQKIKRKAIIYEISLEYPHTFFITKSQILVHNLACSLGLGLAFGSGMISVESIVVAASFLGIGLYSLFGKKHKPKTHITYNPNNKKNSTNKKPDDDDEKDKEEDKNKKEKKIKIPDQAARHIFRDKAGHLINDTIKNRTLLLDLVADTKNFIGKCSRGNNWYSKILPNGKQLWARVRENFIRNGGLNDTPKKFHPKSGLCRPFPPGFKM